MIKLRLQADVVFCLQLRRGGGYYCLFLTVCVGQLKFLIIGGFWVFLWPVLTPDQCDRTGLWSGCRWSHAGRSEMVGRGLHREEGAMGLERLHPALLLLEDHVQLQLEGAWLCHLAGYDLTIIYLALPNRVGAVCLLLRYELDFQLEFQAGALKVSVQCSGFCCLPQVLPLIKVKSFSPGISSLCKLRQFFSAIITPAWSRLQTEVS